MNKISNSSEIKRIRILRIVILCLMVFLFLTPMILNVVGIITNIDIGLSEELKFLSINKLAQKNANQNIAELSFAIMFLLSLVAGAIVVTHGIPAALNLILSSWSVVKHIFVILTILIVLAALKYETNMYSGVLSKTKYIYMAINDNIYIFSGILSGLGLLVFFFVIHVFWFFNNLRGKQ